MARPIALAASLSLGLLTCTALGLSACSARSSLPTDEPPLTPSYRPLADCSDPLWVEGGLAYVGAVDVYRDRSNYVIDEPDACTKKRFNGFVDVDPFYLDVDEVTPACYASCVSAGGCGEAPARDEGRPLAISREAAEAFCAFRGGTLPSYAQFARAGSADAASIGLPFLLTSLAQCWELEGAMENPPEVCLFRLARASALENPEYPKLAPRADPMDVGPFGHYDLFGSQVEWTRSRWNFDGKFDSANDLPCDGEPIDDPIDFGEGIHLLYGPAATLRFAAKGSTDFLMFPLPENFLKVPGMTDWAGFRCAYDMVEPEP